MIAGRRPAGEGGNRGRAGDESPPERAPRRAAAKKDEDSTPQVRRRSPRSRTRTDEAKSSSRSSQSAAEPELSEEETREPEPRAVATPEAPEKAVPARRRASGADADLAAIRGAIAQQEQVLAELRESIEGVGQRITMSGYRPRVAVFVDVPNVIYGFEGDGSLNMGKLLNLITDGRDLVRATAYSPVSDDPREPVEQQRFVAPFVPHEYRIVTKPLKRFSDGSIKGNFDVEMAVDMVLMADRVDIISIVSGDADFARAVEVVQQKGVRVEVVAFAGSTSIELRALADRYIELDRVVKQII
ncbi:MAG: NYN domain-containing protein [Chloroflexi bacterium]|nr:NYN domain-containing protein [Chloroflexota bacterium]